MTSGIMMNFKRRPSIVILSLLLMASVYYPAFGGEMTADPAFQEEDAGPVAMALKFFRKTVSRADGRRCMMYPSCSHYSGRAFKKHGFIKGWVMSSDRLLRCGRDEKHLSEQIIIKKQTYVFDPVQHNDFWWSRP